MNYYNDSDAFCAQWLRNLIAAGLMPDGHVDDRSIEDVTHNDLLGFRQWHFFAGIAGWPEALRLCGLSAATGICTGSPPCQDNSIAQQIHGKRQGLRGVRSGLAHQWLSLVGKLRPSLVLFENVPGIKRWQGEVTRRLEGFSYRVVVRSLSAARVGTPHTRRRVWIAADRDGSRLALARQTRSPAIAKTAWPAPPRDVWKADHTGTGNVAHGIPDRVAEIRAAGNAIVPQVAAEFIQAYLETVS